MQVSEALGRLDDVEEEVENMIKDATKARIVWSTGAGIVVFLCTVIQFAIANNVIAKVDAFVHKNSNGPVQGPVRLK